MAAANPLWGVPRIHGELLKLGIAISERTVSRLMPKRRKLPSQTWKAFLQNHVNELVSSDFFTVPTATFRALFVLVVLAHHRRRVLHFKATEHPTELWMGQQMVEAFPEDTAPRYLLRDRDKIYGREFGQRVRSLSIEEVLSAPASPWQQACVEKLIGSIRRLSGSCSGAGRRASAEDFEKLSGVLSPHPHALRTGQRHPGAEGHPTAPCGRDP